AALRVTQHHRQARAEPRRREFDAPHLRRRHDVARHPDHEEIAEPLTEHELRGHPCIGTAEHDGERLLPLPQHRRGSPSLHPRDQATVPLPQPHQRLPPGYHSSSSANDRSAASRRATSASHAAWRDAARPWRVSASYRRCIAFSSSTNRLAIASSPASVIRQAFATLRKCRRISRAWISVMSKCACSWRNTVRLTVESLSTTGLTHEANGWNAATTRNANAGPRHRQA